MRRVLERDLARRRQSVLRFDYELVLARLVTEVRNKLAVWRPCRTAFGRTTRVRKVANIALLRRNREYLTTRFDDDASAGRRQRHVRQSIRDVFPVGHHPRKISRGGDVHDAALAALWIELVNVTCLFEHD